MWWPNGYQEAFGGSPWTYPRFGYQVALGKLPSSSLFAIPGAWLANSFQEASEVQFASGVSFWRFLSPDGKMAQRTHLEFHFQHVPLFFDFCLRSFSSLRFDGYQDRYFMDFDQFFGLFLEVVFISFRIVGK